MPTLEAGVDWSFATYPEYLDRIESARLIETAPVEEDVPRNQMNLQLPVRGD